MAIELDEITQKILLEGDQEILTALGKIGKDGSKGIDELSKACEAGASSMEALGGAIAIVAQAISTATAALINFAAAQNDITQKTAFLAEAFGTTTQNLQAIEAAFAQAGVSANTFERFAVRLTTTIAEQWPEIAENIRNAGNEQEQAQERMVAANLRVQSANNALADNGTDTANRLAQADSKVEQAYVTLEFAARKAAQTMQHDFESVAGAALSLEAAEQKLAELQGRPTSAADKQALAVKEAQLAVDKARQAASDAILAQQEHQAQAVQKQKDAENALAEAQQKRHKEEEEAVLRTQQLENAASEARTNRAATEERDQKRKLSDIGSITEQLGGIITSGKNAAQAVDLSQVSVRNLERSIINLASAGGKEPTGLQAAIQLSKLFSQATNEQISQEQRLEIVRKLSVTSLSNMGASAAELLKVLEKGPQAFEKYAESARAGFQITDAQIHDVEEFKGALEGLRQQLSLVQQSFAAAISPQLSAILEGLTKSITDADGVLHLFIEGIKGLGAVLGGIITFAEKIFQGIDKAFDLEKGRAFQVTMLAIVAIVAVFAGAVAGIPALIGLVVVALGKVYESWDAIAATTKKAWDAVKDTAVVHFLEGVLEIIGKILIGLGKISQGFGSLERKLFGGGGSDKGSEGPVDDATTRQGRAIQEFSGGGDVDGPGTATSDSIMARLSRGEFVVKAAAVQNYGANLFHSLNAMTFPGFAAGGLVPAPVRVGGGAAANPSSVLNLTIGDRTFSGLRGSKSTIDDLSSYALGRQTTAAGSNPSWMK